MIQSTPKQIRRPLWPSPSSITNISEHQRAQLSSALSTRVGILGGTPGTGKTHTTIALIRALASAYGSHTIAFCAPTGKAANRGAELLSSNGLTIPATTTHRLLEVDRNGRDGEGWNFKRNEFNRLSQMFFICDEQSMQDTDTFASFCKALPDEAHVLLVGDIYQLPPVGHGAPLRDLIRSKQVGYGELNEIRRNSGDIVKGCRSLKNGEYFKPNTAGLDLSPDVGRNWIHRPSSRPSQQIDIMLELMATVPKCFNPIFDIQVICAVNDSKSNSICREELNKILQPHMNPKNPIGEKQRFAVRDKVICTRNAIFELVEVSRSSGPSGPSGSGTQINIDETGMNDIVANGEIGQVCAIEEKRAIIKLMFPQRYVACPLSAGSGGTAGNSGCFDLGYAITCHKSQGSQMPVVLSMLDDSNGANWVTCREWHYTAISRAEKICMTIGKWETLMRQSKRVSLSGRRTFLSEMLQNL
jgi:exodeoxyribonuclease V alpha subunit